MARLIGVVGLSGSGKTTGLRNLPPEQTMLVLPNQKVQLPFAGSKKNYSKYDRDSKKGNMIITNSLDVVPKIMEEVSKELPHIKYCVFDDITHYFNAETQSETFRARKSGGEAFARWADFAAKVFNGFFRANSLRDDLTIIMHFHPEENDTLEGTKMSIKTPGKLLDRDIDIPSYFTYMLYTKVLAPEKDLTQDKRYLYVTNDDGIRPAKTPMGCFDKLDVPNDMFSVIQTIEKYENGE